MYSIPTHLRPVILRLVDNAHAISPQKVINNLFFWPLARQPPSKLQHYSY